MFFTSVFATSLNLGAPGQFEGLSGVTIGAVVSSLIVAALVITVILSFLILIIGGLQWISSGGDAEKVDSAKKKIMAALIGLLIVFSVWAIVYLINVFFGIDIIVLELPSLGGIISGGGGGQGHGLCPCGGGAVGNCASVGDIGPRTITSTLCFECTTSGWVSLGYGGCSVLNCPLPCP